MFTKILIANRGEIACRVAATARRLGVRTVAVFSDADATARHVSLCDEAVRLGPAPARESYLRGDRIIEIALATGAQAIHPGYGFLSENADFAEACAKAGVAFIGPPAAAIRAMGSKSEAKALMEKAKVPLVPGFHGADQDPAFLRREADRIGYPVLIKASAGGGGKGMRVVTSSAEFADALASCKREAAASFGDDRVLVEKYLERPRHIEIQVFSDAHGGALYLFERDCSVQRRHQKVIEEAPAPGMSAERRKAMGEAAVAAARAVGYVGAGTVEFIATADITTAAGHFYFMEMNTRLQVEHPVTEMITGHDLVEWQLRVACGEPLPVQQDALKIHGHAIEARIYAENPDKGFLPAIGRVSHMALPAAVEFQRNADGEAFHDPAPVRIDAGVRAGDAISPHYDPMIAKLIVWGATREHALARMRGALAETHIVGLANNVDFLGRLVANHSFAIAQLDTGLIERERATLFPNEDKLPNEFLALACARVLADEATAVGADPWSRRNGWRLNGAYTRELTFKSERGVHDVKIDYARDSHARDGYHFEHGGLRTPLVIQPAPAGAAPSRLTLLLADRTLHADVVRHVDKAGDDLHVFLGGRHRALTLVDIIAHAGEGEAAEGRLSAPMPGKVIAVSATKGARVARGTPLLVMEAMKMEHTIVAPADGVVEEVLFGVGEQVAEGAALVQFTPAT
ncbi:MAG: acetyl/propionyl/methylcrotonyl-CoA carboxylase subunit alpha [Burkholderiales bacterium]|nr:acetyl/propionyl/methylcrotonyl-CoA carboxylase subunit alpha [Burkholderiales bacterium]